MTFDDLNPKFVFFSPVRGRNVDLLEHVEHAIIALDGRAPASSDCSIERLNAVGDEQTLRVELWVNDLDDYTCTYGFLVSSENGRTPFARGERCVVNIDPQSHRPAKWSSEFKVVHHELLKDLPAYA